MGGRDFAMLFAEAIKAMVIVAFVIGIVVTLFFVLVLPRLWEWLKPLIHQWTA